MAPGSLPIPNWGISSGKSPWNNLPPENLNYHTFYKQFLSSSPCVKCKARQYCNCLFHPLLELGFTHEAVRLERVQSGALFSHSPLAQQMEGLSPHNEPWEISSGFRQGSGSKPLWRVQGRGVPGWLIMSLVACLFNSPCAGSYIRHLERRALASTSSPAHEEHSQA